MFEQTYNDLEERDDLIQDDNPICEICYEEIKYPNTIATSSYGICENIYECQKCVDERNKELEEDMELDIVIINLKNSIQYWDKAVKDLFSHLSEEDLQYIKFYVLSKKANELLKILENAKEITDEIDAKIKEFEAFVKEEYRDPEAEAMARESDSYYDDEDIEDRTLARDSMGYSDIEDDPEYY